MKGDVSISWLYALPGNLAGVTPGVYMSAADLLAAIDAGIPLDQLRQGIAETLDEAFGRGRELSAPERNPHVPAGMPHLQPQGYVGGRKLPTPSPIVEVALSKGRGLRCHVEGVQWVVEVQRYRQGAKGEGRWYIPVGRRR